MSGYRDIGGPAAPGPDAETLDRALDHLSRSELDEIIDLLQEAPSPAPEPVPPSRPAHDSADRIRSEIFEWVRALVTAVVFVSVLSLFFVRIIGVSGDSMNPTLEDEERLLISNLFYRPRPGDIVIFAEKNYQGSINQVENGEPLVKRVIAVEGQIVDIDFVTGEVRVDNVLQDEPYIKEPTHVYGDVTFPLAVPPGSLFVLGDNRNDSLDSRYTLVGLVDERYVLGHVLTRVWPLNRFGRVDS